MTRKYNFSCINRYLTEYFLGLGISLNSDFTFCEDKSISINVVKIWDLKILNNKRFIIISMGVNGKGECSIPRCKIEDAFIHSFIQQICVQCLLDMLGSEITTVDKTDQNPCFHGAHSLITECLMISTKNWNTCF